MSLDVQGVSKYFGEFLAVDTISFQVQPGHIFGFLGTNGAGKTTTMRMILDIYRPDTGSITWNGASNRDIPRRKFGYLPEERGLYPKMRVDEQLLFLAQLYGARKEQVEKDLAEWLERLDITENRTKRVEQLSKGNQQKIQFLAAILHDPEILILDEPFSGLDPVNAAQIESAFLEMRDRGKMIIFSTHQLDSAQDLSQEVAIIDRGKLLITGDVESVRRSTGQRIVRIGAGNDPVLAWLDDLPDVQVVARRQGYVELVVTDDALARRILAGAMDRGLDIVRFEITSPSLNDIFLSLVGKARGERATSPAPAIAVAG